MRPYRIEYAVLCTMMEWRTLQSRWVLCTLEQKIVDTLHRVECSVHIESRWVLRTLGFEQSGILCSHKVQEGTVYTKSRIVDTLGRILCSHRVQVGTVYTIGEDCRQQNTLFIQSLGGYCVQYSRVLQALEIEKNILFTQSLLYTFIHCTLQRVLYAHPVLQDVAVCYCNTLILCCRMLPCVAALQRVLYTVRLVQRTQYTE